MRWRDIKNAKIRWAGKIKVRAAESASNHCRPDKGRGVEEIKRYIGKLLMEINGLNVRKSISARYLFS
jgi:hypothetical protein